MMAVLDNNEDMASMSLWPGLWMAGADEDKNHQGKSFLNVGQAVCPVCTLSCC